MPFSAWRRKGRRKKYSKIFILVYTVFMVRAEALRSFVDIFFPPVCPFCTADIALRGEGLCGGCAGRLGLHLIKGPVCRVCGAPMKGNCGPESTCGACIKRPPRFSSARSLYVFSGGAREAVHCLKYRGRTMLGPVLGRALAGLVSSMNFSPEVVLPVPLHRKKLRARGFNQSVVLARHMARSLGLRADVSSLARSRHTASQVGLNTKERRRNVAGAFVLRRAQRVGGRRVLLVDDVLTTGATVNECSRVLRAAGAEVAVVTLARAVPD